MRTKPYQPSDLEDFWETRVNRWLLDGVEACVKNNANIGAATLIFCYIEFFGGLVEPNTTSRNKFCIFCEKYLARTNHNYSKYKQKLYSDFRCGLAHEAIMKQGTGIFRSDDPSDCEYSNFEVNNGALFLDIISLKADLYNAVNILKEDLDTDYELRKNAVRRLRDLNWELPEEAEIKNLGVN